MLDTITSVVVTLLGVHIIVKFAFFLMPYAKRRKALDKSYRGRPSATSAPLPTSPLKEMSYAIQSSPWRPWPQMAVLAVLVAWNLVLMFR